MSDALIVSALVAAVLIGVGAAAFLVMRSPSFWVDAGKQLGAALMPEILRLFAKRLTAEEEAEMRAAIRAGRYDEWFRNRMRRKKS